MKRRYDLIFLAIGISLVLISLAFAREPSSSYAKGFQIRSIDKQWRV